MPASGDPSAVQVAKVFGPAAPERFRQGEREAQMTPASPFSPGTPIGPYDGYDRHTRQFNFTTGYNISTRPRLHEAVSFSTLTGLVESYDVCQIVIWHRIDSIRSLDWKLLPADHINSDVTDAVPLGLAALRKPDRKHYFKTWLAKYLYDTLAWDAGTLFRLRNRGGRCIGLQPVDGRLVAPLLDYWGNSPDPPAEAYVQYVNGLPWNWLTRDDLIYEPFRPVTGSPYGRPPIESVILNANTDLRFQVYFLQRFTSGNLPAAFAASPESWSPEQIEQWQQYWDAMMYGDQSEKHQIKWMPPGTKFEWSNEKDFSDQFSMYLLRKTCAAFHVVPSDLGFTETVNRSSGESQADVQHRVGDLPLMEHVEGILSAFLLDDLGLPLKFEFDRGEEQVDQLAQAEADQKYMDRAVVSASEIREMRYGLVDATPIPRVFFSERAGPIPLISLDSVAGPVDPQTAAPPPGAKLPHEAFTVVEGVVTSPPLIGEPLAEQEYGPSALPPGSAPVAKDGEGAGITAETGVYSYDLERDDEPDEAAQVAKELAAFHRFERARRKSGEWRDFEFRAVERVCGHNLNDAGRLAVRKAAGEVAVAGLAVLAADTGRVLMLQRALCDDDPAAGKLEFPGGHLDGTETPLQAAWREFAEETGCAPPPGVQTGTWTGSSQIYQGIVWTTDNEASVPVRGEAFIPNPDDPDGDAVEAVMWVDPADLPGNPMLRPELVADLDAVMAALGCAPDCCGAECCTGGCCNGAAGCQCGPGEVAKAGDAPPKGDPADWSGIWAVTYERREKLLAKHERAVLAAWNDLTADLSPRTLVREFREDIGQVAKLADPDRPWWKDRGRDAALAWLLTLEQRKGWAALLAAIEAAIRDGMAEGEADSLAVAADRQGVKDFPVAAAFTAAAQALQGDPQVSQRAQETAQAILAGTAAALSVTLADGAQNDASDDEMADAVSGTVTGPDVSPVKSWLANALWAAAGAGLTRLIGKLMTGTPPTTAPVPSAGTTPEAGPTAPPTPPGEEPEPGLAMINWVCEGGNPCPTCLDNQSGSPYAPDDVPQYLAHNHCQCALYLASDVPSSYFAAYLLN